MKKNQNRWNLYFNETEDSQYALAFFEQLKVESESTNLTECLGEKLKEYDLLVKNEKNNEELTDMIAKKVADNLRPVFLRSANADKNSRIILEVLNGILLQNQYTSIATTDEILTTPLKKAIDKVEEDIERVIQRNIARKTDSKEGAEVTK